MTGWRLGWSVWPKKIIDFANKLCVNDHSCPNSIAQYAGIEALRAVKKAAGKTKIIGVTVLTSIDNKSIKEIGFKTSSIN